MASASAPGKINLIGGYSILEKGNISFGITVDKRATATVKKTPDEKIEINCPDLRAKSTGQIKGKKIEIKTKKETLFVETALKTTFSYLQLKKIPICGLKITTTTDQVFASGSGKSGLGASAAVTVATVAAVLAEFAPQLIGEKETMHKLSQLSHAVAQGKAGSGLDVAQACYGSCKYSRYSPEIIQHGIEAMEEQWDYSVEPLALPPLFHAVVANIVGKSTSTTNAVKKVAEFKERNKAEYSRIITALNTANQLAISAVEKLNTNSKYKPALDEFVLGFERGRMLTRELGDKSGVEIEPPELAELIKESKNNGALVAKLPGAGGGDSIVALCTSSADAEKLKKFWGEKSELEILQLKIENRGYEILS